MGDGIQLKEADLFAVKPEEYSSEYRSHLLEQYKVYVKSHEVISERREGANKFFVSLNSALVAAVALLWKPESRNDVLALIVVLGAMAICVYWRRVIRSYDNLNTGKFAVIHALERRLPAMLFEAEWKALGEGKDLTRYKPVSHLERSVPLIFGALYVAIAIYQASLIKWPWA